MLKKQTAQLDKVNDEYSTLTTTVLDLENASLYQTWLNIHDTVTNKSVFAAL